MTFKQQKIKMRLNEAIIHFFYAHKDDENELSTLKNNNSGQCF